MLESLRNKKILVVVAHPDDELLGLGATMNKLITDYGCTIRAVILGEGITSRGESRDVEFWNKQLQRHKENIESARKSIGYSSVGVYDFPDNRFDSVDLLDIIKVVEEEKTEFNPEIIFTHHGGDVNVDHQRTFEAVITAVRPMSHEKVKAIITFETPSGTEWRASTDPKHFIPNMFVEVSELNLQAKIQGMEAYEFEKRKYPHPRSPEALKILAQQRGVIVGKEYAEAFTIVRAIN
ncbi:PIG-L family deacetylase [Polaribacter aestuariivivens]|uniref:PIG-L family deacetylase n=1 Tax=Polaribacter aestuariivivens TaxID=2304626 RepID=A0A5S3N3V4_9FLAO|nr:PIG-L family deacetylase [Polaribacter aestuariivivens]TMM29154.1 PIG-L family deacetylase [Polaribacter aestuariivivens]